MTLLNFKLVIPDGTPCRHEDAAKEKMFLECYSWLVECALNITHGQRERAEDLVHDVFVRFLDRDLLLSEHFVNKLNDPFSGATFLYFGASFNETLCVEGQTSI